MSDVFDLYLNMLHGNVCDELLIPLNKIDTKVVDTPYW